MKKRGAADFTTAPRDARSAFDADGRSKLRPLLLLLRRVVRLHGGGALLLLGLEVLVVVIRDVQPRVAHLVDGAVAVADPLIRIRVRLVRLRVVVPRGQ